MAVAGLRIAPRKGKAKAVAMKSSRDTFWGLAGVVGIIMTAYAVYVVASEPDVNWEDVLLALGLGFMSGALLFVLRPLFPPERDEVWGLLFVGGLVILRLLPRPVRELGGSIYLLAGSDLFPVFHDKSREKRRESLQRRKLTTFRPGRLCLFTHSAAATGRQLRSHRNSPWIAQHAVETRHFKALYSGKHNDEVLPVT